jgi:hypothetical protein
MFVLTQARLGIAVSWGKKDPQMIQKALRKVSIRIIGLQNLCQLNLINTGYELNLYHRFPKEIYAQILLATQRYRNPALSLELIGQSVRTFIIAKRRHLTIDGGLAQSHH